MGLFDVFKKKKIANIFPENELEKTLMQAASSASARDEFYQKLLWNELIVLTNGHDGASEGVRTLEKDTTVQLITFENGQIPVFTSTNRIFDRGMIKEHVPFMAMRGQDLFDMAKGATFILNPYSDYGKELIPEEIERLLDGSIFGHFNEFTLEQDTEIQIGQPATYPTELIESLNQLFHELGSVKAAYLATIKMDKTQNPHLMIAIDTVEDMSTIMGKVRPLVEQLLKNELVDFIQLDDKGGISDYFLNETTPFYNRN